jgi:DNA invertase Pin-like site-specific DNA recombinase
MWHDAAQRRFDVVLFWALDRFSREGVLETLNYLHRLNSFGINWRSHTEQYLDSCGVFREAVLATSRRHSKGGTNPNQRARPCRA